MHGYDKNIKKNRLEESGTVSFASASPSEGHGF